MSRWTEKKREQELKAIERELDSGYGATDFESMAEKDARDAAMGKGEDELFEKKLSKEEKKALAKAKREAKKKNKKSKKGASDDEGQEEKKNGDKEDSVMAVKKNLEGMSLKERKREEALEQLSRDQIILTYEEKSTKLHENARDINVGGVTLTFHGKPLLEETEITINYGNRYGFIGPNGSVSPRRRPADGSAMRELEAKHARTYILSFF